MKSTRCVSALLATAAVSCLWAAAAGADASYHTDHIALAPIAGAPLTSGFVQNIHANGPYIYAHELYKLSGAQPDASYQVVLSIWASNTTCSGSPTFELPTAVLKTNGAGNGLAGVTFTPAQAGDLRGLTVSATWVLWSGTTASYTSACEVITLD